MDAVEMYEKACRELEASRISAGEFNERIEQLRHVEPEKHGQRYRHFKGGTYEVIGTAKHTESQDDLVLYKDKDGNIWARPAFLFYGRTYDGQLRFTPIEEGET